MEHRAQLILANRAYLDHQVPPGEGREPPSPNGGLLAALRPVIAPWDGKEGTTWIGAGRGPCDSQWCDERGYELISTPRGPLRHRRLTFDDATWDGHYQQVANGFLWPLFHLVREPLPARASYYPVPAAGDDRAWASYRTVNERFAVAALAEELARSGTCWVHDYQLALVPAMLRARGFPGRIGFFLHTPFPDLESAARYLDERSRAHFTQVLAGILGADLVGVQTDCDADRLEAAAIELLGATLTADGLTFDGREIRVDSYPVGIDADELIRDGRLAAPSGRIERFAATRLPVVVGLERADYTKGIPERLDAVAEAFRQGAKFAYVGISAPTREGVESYRSLEPAIETAAAKARQAAEAAGMLFEQAHETIPWEEVVALQRDADVVFTSSLADGMNLVPLQTAAVQSLRAPKERGLIIAGRDAGVSTVYSEYERDGLVPVDPFDLEAMVETLRNAIEGKLGTISERFVDAVRERDARSWATRFLGDLEGSNC